MKMPVILVAVTLALTSAVRAEWIDLEADWSGASFGNSASATATFSLDTATMTNPGFTTGSPSSAFQNFQFTLTGASFGNGVFTASDFSLFVLSTNSATLDFHSELVGQSTPSGLWGYGPMSVGDFNFFQNISAAPTGSSPFVLSTSSGEFISLTSLHPVVTADPVAVPETGTWVMGLLALGAVVVVTRRSSRPVRA